MSRHCQQDEVGCGLVAPSGKLVGRKGKSYETSRALRVTSSRRFGMDVHIPTALLDSMFFGVTSSSVSAQLQRRRVPAPASYRHGNGKRATAWHVARPLYRPLSQPIDHEMLEIGLGCNMAYGAGKSARRRKLPRADNVRVVFSFGCFTYQFFETKMRTQTGKTRLTGWPKIGGGISPSAESIITHPAGITTVQAPGSPMAQRHQQAPGTRSGARRRCSATRA